MKSFKLTWPFFVVVLFLAALGFGIGSVNHHRVRATRALSTREALKQEHRTLVRGSPTPHEETEAAMVAATTESERVVARMRRELGLSEDGAAVPELGTPVDEYFALGNFAEKMRARIESAGIEVDRIERFGFSAYANAGPEPEILVEVRRQRETVELLIESLVAARPATFLGIKRTEPGRNTVARSASLSEDYFSLPRSRSIAVVDAIDADAFRLEFTGHTGCLRRLLSNLAQAARPLIVRSVEVEQMAKDVRVPEVTRTSSALVIDPTVKRFSVLLEAPRPAIIANPTK